MRTQRKKRKSGVHVTDSPANRLTLRFVYQLSFGGKGVLYLSCIEVDIDVWVCRMYGDVAPPL